MALAGFLTSNKLNYVSLVSMMAGNAMPPGAFSKTVIT